MAKKTAAKVAEKNVEEEFFIVSGESIEVTGADGDVVHPAGVTLWLSNVGLTADKAIARRFSVVPTFKDALRYDGSPVGLAVDVTTLKAQKVAIVLEETGDPVAISE